MELHRHRDQRAARLDDQPGALRIDHALDRAADHADVVVEGGGVVDAAEEAAPDVQPVQVQVPLGGDPRGERRRGLVHAQRLGRGVAVHVQARDAHPRRGELLDRGVQLAVVDVEAEAAAFGARCRLPGPQRLEVPVHPQPHCERGGRGAGRIPVGSRARGRIGRELPRELRRPGDLALRVEIDDRACPQSLAQPAPTLDRAVVDDLLRGVAQRERELVLRVGDHLRPHAPLPHVRDQPGQGVGLEGVGEDRMRPAPLESSGEAVHEAVEDLPVDDEGRRLRRQLALGLPHCHQGAPRPSPSAFTRRSATAAAPVSRLSRHSSCESPGADSGSRGFPFCGEMSDFSTLQGMMGPWGAEQPRYRGRGAMDALLGT